MGFFNPRKPRQFEHKPISYDPKKDALREREARIKQELIAKGELIVDETNENRDKKASSSEEIVESFREDLHRGLRHNMNHFTRAEKRHKSKGTRNSSFLRLLLYLSALIAIIWFLYYR